jgi:glycosyltransferase involved in cell wall biosynthesis
MKNTTPPSVLVNWADHGSRSAGVGAYASFCSRVVRESFAGAAGIGAPAWTARLPRPLPSLLRYLSGAYALRSDDALIYSPTYRAVPRSCNQIVTILDMIPVHHPNQHRLQHHYFVKVLPGILHRCRAVFTLSLAMKSEVAAHFGLAGERIHVVAPGVDAEVFRPAGQASAGRPYLLVAGATLPHKNVHEVIARAGLWAGRYRLVVTGAAGAYRRTLERLAERVGVRANVKFLSVASRDGLVGLLRNCTALVYPSRDEGFGLPPLEALACARPVIVADIPVLRETCGEAGVYVTLGSEQSWREAFALLDDGDGIAKRLAAGRRQVERFSWEACRAALLGALLSVAPELQRARRDGQWDEGSATSRPQAPR